MPSSKRRLSDSEEELPERSAADSSFGGADAGHSGVSVAGEPLPVMHTSLPKPLAEDNPFVDAGPAVKQEVSFSLPPDVSPDVFNPTLDYALQLTEIPLSPAKKAAQRAQLPQRGGSVPPAAALEDMDEDKPLFNGGAPTPRLVIHKLVLTNFKLYAGEQVIGPFHPLFSAVVGPNGSGKSNVIDLMLFVFGFRATKMRQSKLKELIHSLDQHTNLPFCSVDIHFHRVVDEEAPPELASELQGAELQPQPTNPYALNVVSHVVPDSELVVSRKAFREGGSQYYLDGKLSTYSEVQQLLRNEGVDLDHKRFLILQGEVELIAQMKPKAEREGDDGLLEYLEDIIGTTKYKQVIDSSAQQVDDLNEVCKEKEHRFEVVESERATLESKKDTALEFLLKEAQLQERTAIRFQLLLVQDRNAIAEHEEILAGLYVKRDAEQAEVKQHTEAIAQLRQELAEIAHQQQQYQQGISGLSKRKRQLEKEKVQSDENTRHLAAKRKKLEQQVKQALQGVAATQEKLDELQKHMLEDEQTLAAHREQLVVEQASLSEIRKQLSSKTEAFASEVDRLQQELQPWQDKLEANKSQAQLAQSKADMLKGKRTSNQEGVVKCEQQIADLKQQHATKTLEVAKLKQEQGHVAQQIKLGRPELAAFEEKLGRMKQYIATERSKLNEHKQRQLETQNKSKVLQGLMRLQQLGRISGFHGRLGDLGVIDERYDVAVTTACPQLNDLVVETVEVGQQCIEYLRQNHMGYARFILLDKIPQRFAEHVDTPLGVPRLFDLVVPQDPKFKTAFYHVLQDTLVASDLQQARKVAYGAKRWRVVTEDGKVVDRLGTMSGGGTHVSRGGMRTRSGGAGASGAGAGDDAGMLAEELQAKEADLAQREGKYQQQQEKYAGMKLAMEKFVARLPEVEMAISRLELELAAVQQEQGDQHKVLAEYQQAAKRLEEDAAGIAAAEAEVRRLERQREELRKQTVELEQQILALQTKIMEAGGMALQLQTLAVELLRGKIEVMGEKLQLDAVAARKLENALHKHEKSAESGERQLEQVAAEAAKVEEVAAQVRDQLAVVEAELQEATAEKEARQDETDKLKEEVELKRQAVTDLQLGAIELEQAVEKHELVVRRLKRLLEQMQQRLGQLQTRDVGALVGWMSAEEQAKYLGGDVLRERLAEELAGVQEEELEREIGELEEYMQQVKVDVEVLVEYGARSAEFELRRAELNAAVATRLAVQEQLDETRKRRLDEFMAGFGAILLLLKEMYQMITMGGNAELELVDLLDPFLEGILFSVMPPKKSWRNILNLSGGEKTLLLLALVFALHRYKPTPLYVMDEIDAALDFRNVLIVANYIKERTKNAQFVVISLRNNMFELLKQLVGIYKVNNMTRSVAMANVPLAT